MTFSISGLSTLNQYQRSDFSGNSGASSEAGDVWKAVAVPSAKLRIDLVIPGVLKSVPMDPEAARQLASLSTEKTSGTVKSVSTVGGTIDVTA